MKRNGLNGSREKYSLYNEGDEIMKVILDNITYVTKDGKEHYFKKFECEIPDGVKGDENISKEVSKCIEKFLEESK